jgi:hypothetical protein
MATGLSGLIARKSPSTPGMNRGRDKIWPLPVNDAFQQVPS